VGKVRFRLEAAYAAVALKADLVVFTEYFPQQQDQKFRAILEASGWTHQLLSRKPEARANRALIASRLPLEQDDLLLPCFDRQFPANIVAARLPTSGLRVLGVRVPAYEAKQRDLLIKSWEWLESTAASLSSEPAVILGDLNIRCSSRDKVGGQHFQRILDSGWTRAAPVGGYSYYGARGVRSEIDHILTTAHCTIRSAECVTAVPDFTLAGSPSSLSDHAALVAEIEGH
jgi:endonuclease/exonuclease/phosphatase family metal-dependent hydrolase